MSVSSRLIALLAAAFITAVSFAGPTLAAPPAAAHRAAVSAVSR